MVKYLLLLLVLLSPALADDWACHRGNAANTGVAQSTLPPVPKLLWTYETGSNVESTAAIVGDTVFVGTKSGALLAIGLKTGKLKWKYKTGASIAAAPCVTGGVVYVGDEDGILHAVSAATGKKAWTFKTGDKIISSAAAAPGVVLVGSYDNTLYCLDVKTHKARWKFKAEAQVHCTPCVTEKMAIIAGCDGKVRMINLATGKQMTAATLENTNFAAAPACVDGVVYVGALTGEYLAVQTHTGGVAWRIAGADDLGHCFAGAAISGDTVVFATQGQKIVGVRRGTGKIAWQFKLKGGTEAPPTIAGGTVYASGDGVLYGLNLRTGAEIWHTTLGGEIKAAPAIAQGRLVLGSSDGAIYCFGAK
jgi:outer membrane protein assembly factor BamB